MLVLRIPCIVPHCRRTFKDDGSPEVICGKHWRLASPVLRRRKTRLYRAYRRQFGYNPYWHYPAGSPERIRAVRLERLCRKIWDRCKRQAIERSMGL